MVKRAHSLSFTVEGAKGRSQRRYRSSLLATCSYVSRRVNSRRLIGVRRILSSRFIFEEVHVNDRTDIAGQVKRRRENEHSSISVKSGISR